MSRIDWWALSDEELIHRCEVHCYRASGPGGQHRNKTDSAVRLRHAETGLSVVATESRSQHENRRRALRRLREALAFDHRQDAEPLPDFVRDARSEERLPLRPSHALYLPVAAYVLDVLDDEKGATASAASRLGLSTAQLIRFLKQSPKCWQAVQRIRRQHDLKPLH